MARKESKAWDCIHSLCAAHKIDEQNLYKRSRLLLSSYGSLYWSSFAQNKPLRERLSENQFLNMQQGFCYLREFSETETKQDFVANIANTFDTGLLSEMINHALIRVREFPEFGKMHFEILGKCYISALKYSEGDILFDLGIERSMYYDRKKEAIMLFGIVFWTYALRHFEELLKAA